MIRIASVCSEKGWELIQGKQKTSKWEQPDFRKAEAWFLKACEEHFKYGSWRKDATNAALESRGTFILKTKRCRLEQ